jgi:alanine racemase
MNNTATTMPYIEISLDNLLHNVSEIRRITGETKGIMAVVKDLAYGCGAIAVSRALASVGVEWLAIATMNEAQSIRNAGIALPILVLGACDNLEIAWAATHSVSLTLNDIQDVSSFESHGIPIHFHLNVDTGMGRLGLRPSEIPTVISAVHNNPMLVCEGAFTHLACADAPGTSSVDTQLKKFRIELDILRQNRISPRFVHYANSAALMRFPLSSECTLVRPGIALYGCKPNPGQEFPLSLRPIVSLKAPVIKIKQVGPNTPISYGARYVTTANTHIATIPIGYGIGLPRKLTGTGSVLINGKRHAIAGTVTMDYVMVDLGQSTDVKIGDEAVAIGSQGAESITPDDVALHCGTIAYEILCGLSTRLQRRYVRDGKVVEVKEGYYY